MGDIRWDILQPIDPGAQVQQGFATGMALVKRAQTQHALSAYLQNPDDDRAYNALAAYDPQAAAGLRDQRAQTLAKQQEQAQAERERQAAMQRTAQENIVKGARVLRQMKPTDQASWDAALQAAQTIGVDISNVPREYNPEFAQRIVQAADAIEGPPKETAAPASIREYEYAKQQGYQGSYMDFQAETAGPIVTDNGDGTKTITPRSLLHGSAPHGDIPPPPPGFHIEGGPTPQASGNFPEAGPHD